MAVADDVPDDEEVASKAELGDEGSSCRACLRARSRRGFLRAGL